jgi:hypothetical protein
MGSEGSSRRPGPLEGIAVLTDAARMHPWSVTLLLVACSTTAAQVPATEPAAPDVQQAAPDILQRVVCVGASASGGYGWNIELKTRVKLGLLLDQLLPGERQPCLDLGSATLFQAPLERAGEQIDKAIKAEATLVVGVDFLFWFAYTTRYGQGTSTQVRLERLDQGIALLEKLDCPLLIGDIPDMTLALEGEGPFGGPLLRRSMIPTAEEFRLLNERVHGWVASRPNTFLVRMNEFARRATKGESLELRGNRWDGEQTQTLLQKDLLHPTVEGSFGLLVVALDQLVEEHEGLGPQDIAWDVPAAQRGLLEATREAREETLERERKREERRRAREQRKKEAEEDDGPPRIVRGA